MVLAATVQMAYIEIHHAFMKLGEILPAVTNQLPASATVAIGTFCAVIIVALLQSGQSSDDDDSGPGDGGLMQPVGLNA